MTKPNAILLIGPTGSGKSPLGDLLEKQGIWGKKCRHFDFGVRLRLIASKKAPSSRFSKKDMHIIEHVLNSGALLENETFYIAENILNNFIRRSRIEPGEYLILNGLPRHSDQADGIGRIVAVKIVLNLDCHEDITLERIRRNTGGDRSGRTDDVIQDIRRKFTIYEQRTFPLLEYYRKKGVPIIAVPVGVDTRTEDMARELEAVKPGKK